MNMKCSTGEHIKSFEKLNSRATDKPHTITSSEFNQLVDQVHELRREISRLEDRVNWVMNQDPNKVVYIVKDKGNE